MNVFATDPDQKHLGGNISFGDPNTYCPTVWDYVITRFGIESVLDLGSGVGNASFYFHSKGLKIIAVDGLQKNIEKSLYPAIQHDLTLGPVRSRVDLVHCQEVVEHIEEKFLDNLLKSLTAGRIVLMTHAVPGQGGYHHVNEQPAEYWVKNLARYNCSILIDDSNRVRKLAIHDSALFMAQSGLVFVNNERL